MRLSRAEWLLVPLFLLPLVAGGGLGLWARHRYFAGIAVAKAAVRAWREEPGWRQRFLADHATRGEGAGFVPFVRGATRGRAYLPDLSGEPWTFTATYPGGVTPAALADPARRLAAETGAAGDGLDPAAVEFATLLAHPDLDRLRVAALPATTKRFLLSCWPEPNPAAARLLDALADLPPDVAGVHRRGETVVLASGGAWPMLVFPDGLDLPSYREARGDGRLVFEGSASPQAVWRARVDGPLAGTWTLEAPHGAAWWRGRDVARWGAPAGVGLLAFLLLPAALFVAIRKQRRLDEARVRFLTELAHDLRTPLTAVRLHAELLAAGRAPEAKRARYVEAMARESARLSGLLANLLDLSRLERGARRFEPERVAWRVAVDDAVRDFRALYPDRAGDVAASGPADAAVRADRTALQRCLANLLDNAGKYTAPGVAIRVTWDERGVRVADEGDGVPRGAPIFRRYARGTNGAVPGTGLGLSLVRELAEGMGGHASLVPSDRGATFLLELPRA